MERRINMTEFTLKGWDVLVVDDEPDILLLIEYILGLYGAKVTCANSGQDALDLLEDRMFHLGLFDILMSKVTGWDLVKAVRQHHNMNIRTMPLVAVTAMAMPGDANHLLEAGYDAYIAKPIDAESFAATLRALVLNERGDMQPTEEARETFGEDTLAMADQLRRLLQQTQESLSTESMAGDFDFDVAELLTNPQLSRVSNRAQSVDGADTRFEQERLSAEASVISTEHESKEAVEEAPVHRGPQHSIRGFFRRYRPNS
jgi:CheY-like chemotaxis protein